MHGVKAVAVPHGATATGDVAVAAEKGVAKGYIAAEMDDGGSWATAGGAMVVAVEADPRLVRAWMGSRTVRYGGDCGLDYSWTGSEGVQHWPARTQTAWASAAVWATKRG